MTEPEGPARGQSAPVSTTASRLFDLRTVLALLFTVYGLVLLIVGLVSTTEADIAKAGGWNVNLWSGVVMLVIAAFFIVWVRLRPVRAPVSELEGANGAGTGDTPGGAGTGDTPGPPTH
jgi:hypothetical protein